MKEDYKIGDPVQWRDRSWTVADTIKNTKGELTHVKLAHYTVPVKQIKMLRG